MSCKQWNDDWIAHLYGELEPSEERVLTAHLDSCAVCRETLGSLEESQQLLRAATPAVPASPRVVVLQSHRFLARPVWAFAAGVAAAALLFAIGLGAGLRLGGDVSPPPSGPAARTQRSPSNLAATPAGLAELAERQDRFEQQMMTLLQARSEGQPGDELTWPQIREELQTFNRRFEAKRLEDFQFMLGEINASELRQGNRIDLTRQALRYVALSQDPRLSQQ